jgi:hypothetical protein
VPHLLPDAVRGLCPLIQTVAGIVDIAERMGIDPDEAGHMARYWMDKGYIRNQFAGAIVASQRTEIETERDDAGDARADGCATRQGTEAHADGPRGARWRGSRWVSPNDRRERS